VSLQSLEVISEVTLIDEQFEVCHFAEVPLEHIHFLGVDASELRDLVVAVVDIVVEL